MSTNTMLQKVITIGAGMGATATPLAGLWWAGWSPATAMMLYLLETLLAAPLVALRVQLMRPPINRIDPIELRQRREWLQTYLIMVGGFSLASAVFMAVFLFLILQRPLELPALRSGLTPIAVFLVIGFCADLLLGQPLDLAGVETQFKHSLGRVFLLFLAVFTGVWLAAIREPWFLIPFIVLKTVADFGRLTDGASSPFAVLRARNRGEKTLAKGGHYKEQNERDPHPRR